MSRSTASWTGGNENLYLFEAPIDLLSFITLRQRCWRNHSYAAACGVSDKVLWRMLEDYPYIRKVYLCLDNDEAGQTAAKRIAEKLKSKNIEYENLVPSLKDWNEVLLYSQKENAK